MARTPIVYPDSGAASENDPCSGVRDVPAWFRGPDPELAKVRELYVDRGLHEIDVARQLGISRARLAHILDAAGIARRPRRAVACPLEPAELRRRVEAGETSAALAREYEVSQATVRRWLANAGLLPPDPDLPVELLRRLYVDQGLSTRAIAERMGVSRERVAHALAAAGIPARGYSTRHRGSGRDRISDELLGELYVDQGLSLHQLAERFGVTVDYLSSRCRALGIMSRPGAFVARTAYSRGELDAAAAKLYTGGLNVHQVGHRLGVSPSTALEALHRAHVPLRGKGFRGRDVAPRTLIEDLYGDPAIRDCLRRHGVHLPDACDWRPASRWQSYAPLPLSGHLVRELYIEIGLTIAHIAMLCGVGKTQVRARLLEHEVPLRDSHAPCPWKVRQRQ